MSGPPNLEVYRLGNTRRERRADRAIGCEPFLPTIDRWGRTWEAEWTPPGGLPVRHRAYTRSGALLRAARAWDLAKGCGSCCEVAPLGAWREPVALGVLVVLPILIVALAVHLVMLWV